MAVCKCRYCAEKAAFSERTENVYGVIDVYRCQHCQGYTHRLVAGHPCLQATGAHENAGRRVGTSYSFFGLCPAMSRLPVTTDPDRIFAVASPLIELPWLIISHSRLIKV